MKRIIATLNVLTIILFFSCSKELDSLTIIYDNDFENEDLAFIKGGVISDFQGQKVLGFYNKGEVFLELENLPVHSYVGIGLDLYTHGSWDGNLVGEGMVGPDIWGFQVDDWILDSGLKSNLREFKASFSNSPCNSSVCLRQSYPENYPSQFNPKAGSIMQNLPFSCDTPSGGLTTQYRIEKVYPHSGNLLALRFFDLLRQGNIEDEWCDENWSIDNLQITLYQQN
jgi:hypothetical protein